MKLIIQLVILIIVTLCEVNNSQWISNSLYNLNDNTCSGPKILTNYYRENVCNEEMGVISICSNNAVSLHVYENKNCTGSKREDIEPFNKCLPGAYEVACVDDYELPENSYIAINSESCDDYKDSIVSVLATFTNVCQVSAGTSINYQCTSDSAIGNFFYSEDCSGKPISQKMPFNSCNNSTRTTYICNN